MLVHVLIHAFGTSLQGMRGAESRRRNAELGFQMGRSAQHHLFDPRLASMGFLEGEIERNQRVLFEDIPSVAQTRQATDERL
jgi:hypothetical protein